MESKQPRYLLVICILASLLLAVNLLILIELKHDKKTVPDAGQKDSGKRVFFGKGVDFGTPTTVFTHPGFSTDETYTLSGFFESTKHLMTEPEKKYFEQLIDKQTELKQMPLSERKNVISHLSEIMKRVNDKKIEEFITKINSIGDVMQDSAPSKDDK